MSFRVKHSIAFATKLAKFADGRALPILYQSVHKYADLIVEKSSLIVTHLPVSNLSFDTWPLFWEKSGVGLSELFPKTT
jgi:hypothetical protein